MNLERLQVVRDAIANAPARKVSMRWVCADDSGIREKPPSTLFTDCGSVGCICGWTLACFPQLLTQVQAEDINSGDSLADTFWIAGNILDITSSEAEALFMAYWHPTATIGSLCYLFDISKEEIVAHLDSLLQQQK